jgi:shikimate dehydrogenase
VSPIPVTGRTRFYAQLADPVASVKLPEILQPVLDARGLDVAIVPMHVAPDGLGEVVTALRLWQNLVGFGVTMPHKEAVLGLLDELTESARMVGSVNLVRREPGGRLVGTNVDGSGFVAGLHGHGHSLRGRSVLLLGAGGTARAVAFALAGAGVARLDIANRTAARARSLAQAVAARFPGLAVTAVPVVATAVGHDIVINATAAGHGAARGILLVDPDTLHPGTVTADVTVEPVVTPLLAAASRRGLPSVPGAAMLHAQLGAALAFMRLDGPTSPDLVVTPLCQ